MHLTNLPIKRKGVCLEEKAPSMTINRIGITLGQIFAWVRDHPSTLAVGALVIAALLAAPPVRKSPPQADPGEAGDVALFI
jgi:hypothetical protein